MLLAEALLPDLRTVSARCSPAVEELLRDAGRAEELCDNGPIGIVTDEHRACRIASSELVGSSRQTGACIGADYQARLGALEGETHDDDGRPRRASRVGCDDV